MSIIWIVLTIFALIAMAVAVPICEDYYFNKMEKTWADENGLVEDPDGDIIVLWMR